MRILPGDDATSLRTRPHILVVEDNPDTCILMEQILEDLGETIVTSDPEEALSYASETMFDLIILDINLGSAMDGTDVLRELRTNLPYSHTPILALTAYAVPGDREKFLQMGFTAYLSKPFEVDDLLELSDRLLQESAELAGSPLAR